MLDLSTAKKIYIDGKPLSCINVNGTPTWYDQTVTYEFADYFKLKVTKDNKTEYYNLSYAPNKKVSGYTNYITIQDENGETYYGSLSSVKSGDIIVKGGYLSNGYYSTTSQSGTSYNLHSLHQLRNFTNGWKFKFNLQNKAGTYTIDTNLLNDAVNRYNHSIPPAKITVVSSSDNYCELADFEDTWLGLCTSWSDKVRIQLNKTTMDSYYGTFNTNKTSAAYKKWLGTLTHELCHTLGFPDQASHTPSLYDYSRDRTKALYVQANDLLWLKYAYAQNGVDIDSLAEADTSADTITMKRSIKKVATGQGESIMNFDYYDFDSLSDVKNLASNVITATLSYDETRVINIGSDLEIEYNVYTINVISEEKGTLTNRKLKIVPQQDTIVEGKKYRLCLKQYEQTPCSLLSLDFGLEEV